MRAQGKKLPAAAFAAMLAGPAAGADLLDEYMVDPDDGQLDASRYLSEVPLGFLPVPTIITEPAVNYGLGVGALFFNESAQQRKRRTTEGVLLPENISVLAGGATLNGTWTLAAGHLGFWRGDTLRYRGFLMYGDINLDFYSFPGPGELQRPLELNLKGPFVFQSLLYRLPGTGIFVGARQQYRHVETGLADSPDLSFLPPAVGDYVEDLFDQSITTSGLGLVAEYDSRDNPFNPQRGIYYAANYTVFDDAIGSDVDYDSYRLQGLNYMELGERFNLGLRLQYDGVSAGGGERLPPYVPPYVNLRGVAASRYQGEDVAVVEGQLDYKLNERWKVGIFAGLGRAADSLGDLDDADNVDSYGTGFRYLIARRYGFVMGLDVARGPDETAVYVQAGSTW